MRESFFPSFAQEKRKKKTFCISCHSKFGSKALTQFSISLPGQTQWHNFGIKIYHLISNSS